MSDHNSKNPILKEFISLQDASKESPYSQEYLSLLARRGKIFAKKIGRNWYTTRPALKEYIREQSITISIPQLASFGENSFLKPKKFSKPVLVSAPYPLTPEEPDEISGPVSPTGHEGHSKIYEEFERLNTQTPVAVKDSPPPRLLNQPNQPTPIRPAVSQPAIPSAPPTQLPLRSDFSFLRNSPVQKPDDQVLQKLDKLSDSLNIFAQRVTDKISEPSPSGLTLSPDEKEFVAVELQSVHYKLARWNAKGKDLLHHRSSMMAVVVSAIVVIFIFVGGFSFGRADEIIAQVRKAFKDADTVQGHFPGTHADEVLVLDKAGNVSIFGHIETQGQLRSHAPTGVAPIVIDSITKVENLNADYLDNLDSKDFTLAFITQNGNITYDDVLLEGNVEIGKTLTVKGAFKLMDSLNVYGKLGVFSEAVFGKDVQLTNGSLNIHKGNLRLDQGTIVINDRTLVRNLNSEFLQGKTPKDFTLDYVVENGNETNNVAFFNAGLYGGDGTFKTLGVGGNAILGNSGDKDDIVIEIYSEKFSVDANGNFFLGGNVTSNLTPPASTSLDLGAINQPWNNVYANNLIADTASIANFAINTLKAGDGTATDPSITFLNDTNTGFYRIGNDVLGVTASGARRFSIGSTGVSSSVNFEVTGFSSASQTFGSGLTDCSQLISKLTWNSTTGLFSCGSAAIGIQEGSTAVTSAAATISFDAGGFNVTASGGTEAIVKIDYINGPASRALNETITGFWRFTAASTQITGLELTNNASIGGNVVVRGRADFLSYVSISQDIEIGGTASVSNNLVVRGRADFFSNASIAGTFESATALKSLLVGSDTTLTLAPTDPRIFITGTASISSSFEVGGYASFSNTLWVSPPGFSGNIGIGTTSPLTRLEVQGTASASNLLTVGGLQVAGGTSTSYSRFGTNITNYGAFLSAAHDLLISGDVEVDGQTFFDNVVSVSQNLEVTGYASLSNAFFSQNGNVGIGTRNLSVPLEVNSDASISNTFYAVNGGNVGIGDFSPEQRLTVTGNILASTSGNVGFYFNSTAEDDAQFSIVASGTSGSLARLDILGSASQKFLSIASSGNVGIGTTMPSANLHVGSSIAEGGTAGEVIRLALQPYGWTNGPFLFVNRDISNAAFLDLRYGASNLVTVRHTGVVGIGNNSPDQKLDVTGNILASTSGNVDLILNSTTSDDTKFTFSSVGVLDRLDILGSASQAYLSILKGGNVGIGTTSPGQKLAVNGAIMTKTGLNTGEFMIGDSQVLSATNAPLTLTLNGGGFTNVVVPTGNVGIGTAAPTTKFEVSGNASVSGNFEIGTNLYRFLSTGASWSVPLETTAYSSASRRYGSGLVDCDNPTVSKLLWSDTGLFSCGIDQGGVKTEESGVQILATSTILNFDGGKFNLTASGTIETVFNLDWGAGGPASLSQDETVTGIWNFSNGVSVARSFELTSGYASLSNTFWVSPPGFAGNVGIRTSNPTVPFEVSGTSSISNMLYVLNAGNIGIGTSAPKAKLEIATGIASISNAFLVNPGGNPQIAMRGRSDGNSVLLNLNNLSNTTKGDFLFNGSSNLVQNFYSPTGVASTSFLYNAAVLGGSVDIGGVSNASVYTVYIQHPSTGFPLYIASNLGGSKQRILTYGVDGSSNTQLTFNNVANTSTISFNTQVGGSSYISNGNLGIGTRTPTTKLEVKGGTASASLLSISGASAVAYNRFGTNTTGHALGQNNDVLISGDLEVDGVTFLDGNVVIGGGGSNSGDFEVTGVIKASDGTAVSPSYTFSLDQNTGFYRIGDETIGVTTNGVERVRITTQGASVSSLFETTTVKADTYTGDGAVTVQSGGGNTLSLDTGGAGALNIGLTNASSVTIARSGIVTVFNDDIRLAGNDIQDSGANPRITVGATTSITGNAFVSGASSVSGNFQVGTATLYAHAANNRVGVGTKTPVTRLEVKGTASASHLLTTGGLQVAGATSVAYSRFGTNVTTRSLTATNDVIVSGMFEVDGRVFLDSSASVAVNFEVQGFTSTSALFGTVAANCINGITDKVLYNASTGKFTCGVDQTVGSGGGTVVEVREFPGGFDSTIATMSFDAAHFALTASGTRDVTIQLDWGSGGPASLSQTETVTGAWTFQAAASFSALVDIEGTLQIADGTVTAPSLRFDNDKRTGIFRPGANILALVATGSEKFRISESGTSLSANFEIGANKFYVDQGNGRVGINTQNLTEALEVFGNASLSNVFYVANAGNVGIGTSSPSTKLDVIGNASVSAIFETTTAKATTYSGDGAVTVQSGGANTLSVDTGGAAALNIGGTNASSLTIARSGVTTVINDDLRVVGNDIQDSASTPRITFVAGYTDFNDDIELSGGDIRDSGGTNRITFSTTGASGLTNLTGFVSVSQNFEAAGKVITPHLLATNASVSSVFEAALAASVGGNFIVRGRADFYSNASLAGNFEVAANASASSTYGSGLSNCNGADKSLQWSLSNGHFSCQTLTASGLSVVSLSPPSADTDPDSDASIWINDTGGGRFVRFENGGVERIYISSNGDIVSSGALNFAKGSAASTSYSRFGAGTTSHANFISTTSDLLLSNDLEINGSAQFDSFLAVGASTLFANPTTGNVGIGTNLPGARLDISGAASLSGNFGIGTNKFYVDSASGRIGINTKNLGSSLEINGTASISGTLTLHGIITSTNTGSNSFSGSIDTSLGLHSATNVSAGELFLGLGGGSNSFAGSLEVTKGLRASDLISSNRLIVLGNAGIGATGPEQKLEVAGNILASASGNVGLFFNSITENDAQFSIRASGTSGSLARLDILGSASQKFVSIASSGNVGINTTAPKARLEVQGTASASSTYGSGLTDCTSVSNALRWDVATGKFTCGTVIGASGSTIAVRESDGVFSNRSSLSFDAAHFAVSFPVATEALIKLDWGAGGPASLSQDETVTGAWRFTAASNQFTNTLEIGIASASRFLAQDGSAVLPSYTFANDLNTGLFRGGNDILGFATGGLERMRIAADGNVGIFDQSPEQKLTVTGNILASSSGNIDLMFLSTTEDDAKFTIRDSATAGSVARLDILGSASQIFMSIASSGNVGVGTTNPVGLVDITGNLTGSASALFRVGSVSELFRIQEGGNVGIGTTTPIGRLDVFGNLTGSAHPLFRVASAAELFRIQESGNVGIGSTGPSAKLDIVGDFSGSTTPLLRVGSTSDLFRVQENGNVGIGTTNARTTLDVVGNASVSVTLEAATSVRTATYTGDAAVTLLSGGANTLRIDAGGTAVINIGDVNASAIGISRTGITTTFNGPITGAGGNLSITGNASTSGAFEAATHVIAGTVLQAGGAVATAYNRLGTGTTTGGFLTSTDDLLISSDLEVDGTIRFDGTGSHSAAGEWNFDSGTFVIDAGTNRVGVGTTTPLTRLEVKGTASASSFITIGVIQAGNGGATVAYSRFGTGTANNGLISSNNDVFIAGDLEVSGTIIDGPLIASSASISGNFEVTGYASASKFYAQDGTAASPSFSFGVDRDTGFYRPSVNQIALATLGVERLRVDNTGNVGIGDASPEQKFTVTGNILASASGNVDLIVKSTSNQDAQFALRAVSTGRFDILGSASQAHLTIASSGNVGIGDTSPEQKLTAAGNILASASGNVDLMLRSTSNQDALFTIRSTSTGRLDILGSASQAYLTIASSGNIGIGTTNPLVKFHVSGSGSISANFEVQGYSSSSATFGSGLADCLLANNAVRWAAATGKFSCGTVTGGGSGSLEVKEGTTTKVNPASSMSFDAGHFDVTSSGSVEAVVKLDWVNGPASRAAAQSITGFWQFSGGASIVGTNFEVTGNNRVGINAGAATETTLEVGGIASASAYYAADGTDSLPAYTFNQDIDTGLYRIAANNLGITAGGTLRFNIADTGASSAVPFEATTIKSTTYTGDGAVTLLSGGANTLRIDAGGAGVINIGDVNATAINIARTGVTTTFNGAIQGTGAAILTVNGNLNVGGHVQAGDELIVTSAGQFGSTSTVAYSRFGTNTTGGLLTAADDLLISGALEVDSSISFDGTGSHSAAGEWNFDSGTFVIDSGTNNVGIGTTAPTGRLDIVSDLVGNTNPLLRVGSTSELFRVQENGNVGIGTTSPTNKLAIFGATGTDPSFGLFDADVVHGITDVGVTTNQIATFDTIDPTSGGLDFLGFSDDDGISGVRFGGAIGSSNPIDTVPAVLLVGAKKNGTVIQALGANETVLTIDNSIPGLGHARLVSVMGSGNLGIGATGPEQRLEVAGNVLASASGTVGFFFNSIAEDDAQFSIIASGTSGSLARLDILGSASQKFLSIASDGNVGVNDTNPLARFEVRGTASASNFMTVGGLQVAGGSSVAYSRFGTNTTGYATFISAINDLLISGDFEVDGRSFFDGVVSISGGFESGGTASASIFYANSGTAASPSFSFKIDRDTGMWNPTTNELAFSTLGVERLRINSGGNIGINGVTDPDLDLVIANDTDTSNQLRLRSARVDINAAGDVIGGIDFMSNDTALSAPGIVVADIRALAEVAHSAATLTTGIAFRTSQGLSYSEKFRITGAGNVGIWDSTPDAIFEVVASGAGDIVQISSISGADGDYFTIESTGEIGIGTITPTARLQIIGDVPNDVSTGTGTAATSVLTVTAGRGGDTSDNDGTAIGGIGGPLTLTTGVGGIAQLATVSNTGGAGGALTLTGGNGGAAAITAAAMTGGAGGAFNFTAGIGGAATASSSLAKTGGGGGAYTWNAGTGGASTGTGTGTNTGGAGGAITIRGGVGGAANSGTGVHVGGAGGAVTIGAGNAGIGGTATVDNGDGALLTLTGGSSAAASGSGGGAVTITGAAGTTTGTGGIGGAITLTAGAAGGTQNLINRAGGNIVLTTGASIASASAGVFVVTTGASGTYRNIDGTGIGGTGGAITYTMGAGGTVLGTTTSNGGIGGAFTITGGAGGAASFGGVGSSGNNTGGVGSIFSWTGGAGGAAAGVTSGNNLGGASGAVTLTTGTGGASSNATGNNTGGAGGLLSLSGGAGGGATTAGVTNTGGVGATINIIAGTGGAASGATTNNGANGGALTVRPGSGGVGTFLGTAGDGGDGGLLTLSGGIAGAASGGNGGGVTISTGVGTTTGTGGTGGTLTITGGAAGGTQNRINRAGGAVVVASGASVASASGGAFTVTTGASGTFTSADDTSTGGIGGAITFTMGAGGTVTASLSSVGGAGGTFTITGGAGGASSFGATGSLGNNTGGAGSPFTWTAGVGGAAAGITTGNNQGGNGGAVTFTTGAGGASSNAAGTNTGGNAGLLSIVGGTGGATTTAGTTNTGGTGAGITLTAGAGGTATGATGNLGGNGGVLTLTGGAGGAGTGAEGGRGGNVLIQGGLGGNTADDGGGGHIIFETASTITRTEAMRITSGSFVGIGTTTPTSLLDISNASESAVTLSRADTVVVADDVLGRIDFWSNDANLTTNQITARIEARAGTGGITADAGNTYLSFLTSGTNTGIAAQERMRITQGGNIGIGTSAPLTRFEVDGGASASRFITVGVVQAGGASTVSYSRFGTNATNRGLSTADDLLISGDLEVDGAIFIDGPVSVSGGFEIGGTASASFFYAGNGTAASPSFSFRADQDTGMFRPAVNQLGFSTLGAERLRINASGSMGINTTTPAGLLALQQPNITTHALVANRSTDNNTASGSFLKFRGAANQQIAMLDVKGGFTSYIASISPTLAGSVQDANRLKQPTAVVVSGRFAYIAASASRDGFSIVDVANPTAPVIIASIAEPVRLASASSVAVSGRYAYVTAKRTSYFSIIDVSRVNTPLVAGAVVDTTQLASPSDIAVVGRYAYVTSEKKSRLTVVDVSNPSSPLIVSSLVNTTHLASASSVFIQGRYAYVTAFATNRLTVVDILNPSKPYILGSLSDGTNLNGPKSAYVSGRYAYVTAATGNRLTVVDVSNPAAPTVTGSVNDTVRLASATSVVVSGRYAYVTSPTTGSGRLTIVDVFAPATPTVVGTVSSTQLNTNEGLYVSGHYAYTTARADNRLVILDLTGFDIPSLNVGDIAAGHLQVWDNADVGSNFTVGGGLSVGSLGIKSDGRVAINVASMSNDNAASPSQEPLLKIVHDKSFLTGDTIFANMAASTSATRFSGNYVRFQTGGIDRVLIESSGSLVASGAAQFGWAPGFATVSYNRFGVLTTTDAHYISSKSDVFISADLEGRGSLSFAGPASLSNTLWIGTRGATGNVGIGTAAPAMLLHILADSSIKLPVMRFQDTNVGGARTWDVGILDNVDTFNIKDITANLVRLRIDSGGNVGIGITDPGTYGVLNKNLIVGSITDGENAQIGIIGSISTDTTFADLAFHNGASTLLSNKRVALIRAERAGHNNDSNLEFFTSTNAGGITEKLRIQDDGNIGIGTTGPSSLLDVRGTGNTYIEIDSSGANTLDRAIRFKDSAGSDAAFLVVVPNTIGTDSVMHFFVGGGAVGDRKMTIHDSGNVGIGTTGPVGLLEVNGNLTGSTNPLFLVASGSTQLLRVQENGNVGIGLASNSAGFKLDVTSGGAKTARFGTGSADTVVIGGGVGKITVGAFDPVYTIDGTRYATYGLSMIGMKEEATGVLQVTTPFNGVFKQEIDIDTLPIASDLWLFAKVTTLKEHLDEMSVLLTPKGGNARVWYSINKPENKIIIYSSQATAVSYRFSAPRFDTENWTNYATDDVDGYILPPEENTASASGSDPEIIIESTSGVTIGDVLAQLANAVEVVAKRIRVTGDIIAQGVRKTYFSVSELFPNVDMPTMVANWNSRSIAIDSLASSSDAGLFQGSGVQAAADSKIDLAENGEYLATYGVDSTRGEIQISGTSNLEYGQAKIFFDYSFTSVISDKVPLKILMTPTTAGITGQIYVATKTIYGFEVKELNGSSNGKFDWLVIARRKGFDTDYVAPIELSPSPSASPELTPSPMDSPVGSPLPSVAPSPSPEATPSPEVSPSPLDSPVGSPLPSVAPTPSIEPSPSPSPEASPDISPTPSPTP